ncbi:MAG: hypothetical protein PHX83_02430 [Acidobacteriia bacterium]|nr:hypothetical protein [Terriglobia bacterium]
MVKSPPKNTQRLMPRLAYRNAAAAIEFLTRAFGFEETGRFAPEGQVIYSEMALNGETLFAIGTSHEGIRSPQEIGGLSIELFCCVDDVDRHYAQAKAAGATIVSPLEDKFWGERCYDAIDCEGHRWRFRKTVKIVHLPDSRPKR